MEQKIKIEEKGLSPVEIDKQTTREYRARTIKLKEWTTNSLVPITSDVMFKTMIANRRRKKYLSRLLSYILHMPEEEIFNHFEYLNTELDRDFMHQKGERVDLLGKIHGVFINVEMNKTPLLERNLKYLERITVEKIYIGTDSSALSLKAVQINLNDVCYKDDEIVSFFSMRDKLNRGIGNKVLVNICIPLIRKKMYSEGVESLEGLEQFMALMTTTSKEKARKIARNDELMQKYVKEAKQVEKKVIPFYRDLEVDYKDYYIEEGREEGRAKERMLLAQKMLQKGITLEELKNDYGYSVEEIEMLKKELEKSEV